MTVRPPSIALHYSEEPQIVGKDGSRTWLTRGANFVIAYSEGTVGSTFERPDGIDEYFVFINDGSLTIETADERQELEGETLAIVPPGQSRVTLGKATSLVRVFTKNEADLVAASVNDKTYADGAPEVAPIPAGPEPRDGYRIRTYRLSDYYAGEEGPTDAMNRFLTVFRTRKLMVAAYPVKTEPRDITKLSPHSHADFEQASVALSGRWIHHLRFPWGRDSREWLDDRHDDVDSPSVLVIPAGAIHTSAGTGTVPMQLLDVFGPPRKDFLAMPGVVRNIDEYPEAAS